MIIARLIEKLSKYKGNTRVEFYLNPGELGNKLPVRMTLVNVDGEDENEIGLEFIGEKYMEDNY